MKASSNFTLSLTGITVKLYMLIAVVWSKGNERYTSLRAAATTAAQPARLA